MKNKAAQQLGRKGGKASSESKAAAARKNGAKGGRPGVYSVIQSTEQGDEKLLGYRMHKGPAVALAEKHAGKGDKGIVVSFFRKNDGQTVYLNQDGNHAITGEFWG